MQDGCMEGANGDLPPDLSIRAAREALSKSRAGRSLKHDAGADLNGLLGMGPGTQSTRSIFSYNFQKCFVDCPSPGVA